MHAAALMKRQGQSGNVKAVLCIFPSTMLCAQHGHDIRNSKSVSCYGKHHKTDKTFHVTQPCMDNIELL